MADTTNYGWPMPDKEGIQQTEIEKIATALSSADGKVKEVADALAAQIASFSTHTHSFGSLTDRPTTLGGYGIADAYTKTQTDSEIAAKVSAAIDALVNGAPAPLDTLNELAAAIGNDPDFAATIAAQIGSKLPASQYSAGDILAKLKTVDGPSSGLSVSQADNADKLDNKDSSDFAQLAATSNTFTGELKFNRTLSSGNQLMDWQQDYGLYSDNTGTFGSTRLWIDTPDEGEVHIGPRAGSDYLDYFRVRALSVDFDGTTTFQIAGNDVWHEGNLDPSDYAETADLASTANGKGASTIGIEDSAGNITATNVEGALAELSTIVAANTWTELSPTATTSGTAIDWTDIPAGVTDIELWFNGVSVDSTDDLLVQIGTGGSLTTSGYNSGSGVSGSGSARVASTAGMILFSNLASYTHTGVLRFHRTTGDTWVSEHSMFMDPTGGIGLAGGGSVTLSGDLDNIRLRSVVGTQSFDAGSVQVRYK